MTTNAVISSITPAQQVAARGIGIKDAARGFYNELTRIMKEYSNNSSDAKMTVMGITLEGEERFGMMGTMLINEFMNQNTNAMETVMTQFSTLMKYEQEIGKL